MITRLKLERVRLGISQLNVALRTGISAGRLSLLERGIVEPRPDEARRIEYLFGMRAGRLFIEVGPPSDLCILQPRDNDGGSRE
ncbi:MAG TPA: helix-turn-helix transcriptional regulator [Nitrospiraceae bacterium]|nr:helix-turn-helix transcriptional regulator [Nitrospiraceae bacterium]